MPDEGLRIKIDVSELIRASGNINASSKLTPARVWQAIRRAAFLAERNIKIRMPVDTGRARASWGHDEAPLGTGLGIWEEDEQGLSLTQGTKVEYVEYLKQGSSSQAPAGFIDAEAERAGMFAAEDLTRILDRSL